MWRQFLDITTNIKPILGNRVQITAVRLMGAEMDAEVLHLEQMSTDPLQLFQVSNSWGNAEGGQEHDAAGNVKTSQ